MTAIPIVDGLDTLAPRYDAFILDLWGVVHDGVRPFPAVPATLARLQAAGKRVVMLSNAPRRVASVVAKLDEMGIDRSVWDHVMSSGEATYEALRDRSDPFHAGLGPRLYHLGPERDVDVYAGLDFTVVDTPETADWVLCTGIDDADETVEDHRADLEAARARDLPLVCANPDLIVVVGGHQSICAGMLAAVYEEMGGTVAWHGKPHASVYRRCFDLLDGIDRSRILAVGDSFRTDIAGAERAGIDSLFVAGGIHAPELAGPDGPIDPSRLERLAREAGHRPSAAIAALQWSKAMHPTPNP